MSFYLLMALFPALAALVSVFGLVTNPADVAKDVASLSGMLPASTVTVIGNELRQLVSVSHRSLGLGVVIGVTIALWSGVLGMTGLMEALGIASDQPERRGWIRFNATALLLTLVVTVGGTIALVLIAGLPAVLAAAGVRGVARWITQVGHHPFTRAASG